MKKIFFLITISFFFLFIPSYTSAHELATDGNIGAIFHAEPEDDPVAGEPSYFFFDFKSKDNTFVLKNCLCNIEIYEKKSLVYSKQLTINKDNQNSGNASYTFPKKDDYSVQVVGKAKNGKTFQPFRITYDVMVNREKEKNTGAWTFFSTHYIHFGIGVVILLLSAFFGIKKLVSKKIS